MTKTLKASRRQSILVPAVEEVPRISDLEREQLRASLDKARAEIAAGDYDVLTPEVLRAEFDAVYYDGKSDAEIGAALAKGPARRSDNS